MHKDNRWLTPWSCCQPEALEGVGSPQAVWERLFPSLACLLTPDSRFLTDCHSVLSCFGDVTTDPFEQKDVRLSHHSHGLCSVPFEERRDMQDNNKASCTSLSSYKLGTLIHRC
jgi:hypothetical protein